MALVGLTKAYHSGGLKRFNIEAKYPFDPLEYMRRNIEKGKIELNSVCPGVSLKYIDYGSSCTNAAYDIGVWAHAYLANKFGSNNLLNIFYPNLQK